MRKIKHMTALLALGLALGAAWVGTAAGPAHADPTGNETCGGQVTGGAPNFSSTTGTWFFDAIWFCGTDKTFTMEIQHTTNGGATFADWGTEHGHRSPAGCNNGCGPTLFSWSGTCANTGSYREVANNNNSSWRSAWKGAGMVC